MLDLVNFIRVSHRHAICDILNLCLDCRTPNVRQENELGLTVIKNHGELTSKCEGWASDLVLSDKSTTAEKAWLISKHKKFVNGAESSFMAEYKTVV